MVNDTLKNATHALTDAGTLNTATKKPDNNAHKMMTAEIQCRSFWPVEYAEVFILISPDNKRQSLASGRVG
ncbi:hypothetical protein BK651_10825 [Pseudomonas rhodesiae]|nr:hypothetical protein BK650_12820 [Pseudomonas rhodesiae]ROM65811.1 hypothetical protein BK651_10825 [Pseudomonas rhodesiae]